jgi:hypothetical protein
MKSCVLAALTLASFWSLLGCSTRPECKPEVTSSANLAKYLHADPVTDALKAIKQRDLRFLAVRGYAVVVSGVPDFREKYASKYTYRVIDGTSDTFSNVGERNLQLQVRDYAKNYNQTLLKHLNG